MTLAILRLFAAIKVSRRQNGLHLLIRILATVQNAFSSIYSFLNNSKHLQ